MMIDEALMDASALSSSIGETSCLYMSKKRSYGIEWTQKNVEQHERPVSAVKKLLEADLTDSFSTSWAAYRQYPYG